MAQSPLWTNLINSGPVFREALKGGNWKVLKSLLGPAYRGFIRQTGKRDPATTMKPANAPQFNWTYDLDHPELRKLYEIAKQSQWNSATDLDWSLNVDPYDHEHTILPEDMLPMADLPSWKNLTQKEKDEQTHALASWIMSQFLHGEQGALFAAAQVTQAVPWTDGKLYGSTQVMDEGRHVEVFHTYLADKLEKLYEINDNLYVIIDALMSDSRWDIKFLGMQIMVEGLALGAFGTLRKLTKEPLMKEMLKYIITDEARHVHYGVLALQEYYTSHLSEKERIEREDWAFEMSLLLRNRFLAHEFYDEYYAHQMKRRDWDRLVLNSKFMDIFRHTMFRRIVPNLKRIGLLTDRVRPRYDELGLLQYAAGKAAPDLTAEDLMEDALDSLPS
ncbi:MAG: ferritin-like domain-containing protein [Candidatus Marinimicrobia bacterium]|nr:ferritin-like domain-containing protein [Candidatus Neomarinimicrobiota bacterium]